MYVSRKEVILEVIYAAADAIDDTDPTAAVIATGVLAIISISIILIKIRYGWTWAIIAFILTGVLQNTLVTVTGFGLLRSLDDVALAILTLFAVIDDLRDRGWRWMYIPVVIGGIIVIGMLRSPDVQDGLLQARQFVIPVLLVTIAIVVRQRINMRLLLRVVTWITLAIATWMIAESIIHAPLVNPLFVYTLEPAGSGSLRAGLPPSYISDLGPGVEWFRPGGPFFNPPISGIFLASGVYATMLADPDWLRRVTVPIVTIATTLAFARAGLLLIAVVVLGVWLWERIGKVWSLAIGAVLSAVAASFFWSQGATASHAIGLFNGLLVALRNPLGDGLGQHGYFATGSSRESSESLAGVAFASFGIVAVLATLALIVAIGLYLLRRRRDEARPALYLLGVLLVCALSESAASLRGTILLWFLTGLALYSIFSDCSVVLSGKSLMLRVGSWAQQRTLANRTAASTPLEPPKEPSPSDDPPNGYTVGRSG